jgi:autoinducer 2-degrading protein
MLKWLRFQTATSALVFLAVLLPLTTQSAVAQPTQYYVQLVDYEIAPAGFQKFIEALKENGVATIKETGCRQFDISQSASNPNQVFIYEGYEIEAAVQAHRASDHFKKYLAATKDIAVVKREVRPMVSVVHSLKAN